MVRIDGDHENRPKRRQTRRLGLRYYVFYFNFFSCHSFEDLGCIYVLQAREWFGSTAITKTGPNDARHVVWALGTMFFFFFFCVHFFFFIFIIFFFFFFFFFFRAILYILTNEFLF